MITVGELRSIIRETLELGIEKEIAELRSEPEFESVESFIESKLADDVFSYNFIELQALARNVSAKKLGRRAKDLVVATATDIANVKKQLEELGFEFVKREPDKRVRGINSPIHGTSPFAGSGGGGSGFGSDFSGTTFLSYGGGPGAIGGGYDWDANDPKNLSMGSRKKKK